MQFRLKVFAVNRKSEVIAGRLGRIGRDVTRTIKITGRSAIEKCKYLGMSSESSGDAEEIHFL